MRKHVITQQLYNLSPYPTCHDFSTIHHTPIGWYLGTIHLCEQVIGRVNTLPDQHPREETGEAFLVRSNHALFAERWPSWWVQDRGLWRRVKAIKIGMIPAAEATLGGDIHVVPKVLAATFGIAPAGNGELGASGCIGPSRFDIGTGPRLEGNWCTCCGKSSGFPIEGPCWDRGTCLPKVKSPPKAVSSF